MKATELRDLSDDELAVKARELRQGTLAQRIGEVQTR